MDAVVSGKEHRTGARVWVFDPDALKVLLEAKGADSYEAMAELLDCDPTTIWRALTGRTKPLAETALQWEDALECPPRAFYYEATP